MAERMSASIPTKAPVGILLAITVVTGIVDAVGYLALGRVFTANMTRKVWCCSVSHSPGLRGSPFRARLWRWSHSCQGLF
jgi:hypothetical protein